MTMKWKEKEKKLRLRSEKPPMIRFEIKRENWILCLLTLFVCHFLIKFGFIFCTFADIFAYLKGLLCLGGRLKHYYKNCRLQSKTQIKGSGKSVTRVGFLKMASKQPLVLSAAIDSLDTKLLVKKLINVLNNWPPPPNQTLKLN